MASPPWTEPAVIAVMTEALRAPAIVTPLPPPLDVFALNDPERPEIVGAPVLRAAKVVLALALGEAADGRLERASVLALAVLQLAQDVGRGGGAVGGALAVAVEEEAARLLLAVARDERLPVAALDGALAALDRMAAGAGRYERLLATEAAFAADAYLRRGDDARAWGGEPAEEYRGAVTRHGRLARLDDVPAAARVGYATLATLGEPGCSAPGRRWSHGSRRGAGPGRRSVRRSPRSGRAGHASLRSAKILNDCVAKLHN